MLRSARIFVRLLPDFLFFREDYATSVFIRAPALPSVLVMTFNSTDGKAGARMR